MTDMIRAAGFTDVKEAKYKLPLGPWSTDPKYREIGKFFELFYKTGLQGWLMRPLTEQYGMTWRQVNEECVKCFDEVNARRHHYYFTLVIAIGRKAS